MTALLTGEWIAGVCRMSKHGKHSWWKMQNTERGYHHGRTKYIQSSLLICIQANASKNHQNYGAHCSSSSTIKSVIWLSFCLGPTTELHTTIPKHSSRVTYTAMGMNKILHLEWNIYKLRILISHDLCFTFIPTSSITISFI